VANGILALWAFLLFSEGVVAQVATQLGAAGSGAAGSSAAGSSAAAGQKPVVASALPLTVGGSCVETVEAATRPRVSERFPARGLSGHQVILEVEVTHGKGQSVLPSGFRVQREGPASDALKQAGFVLPDAAGPAVPSLASKPAGELITTRVLLPFLVLPEKPGRQSLTLPSVPIALARASGEVVTLCTSPHSINVEDPTANTPNPKPKANPNARRQREEWTALKYAVFGLLGALVLAALTAFLVSRWLRRPKRAAPPIKARPPWEVARESLFDLRHAGLVSDGRAAEHYERAANIIRQYLGDRFGFDGLECTTRETVHLIRDSLIDHATGLQIRNFLIDADLVKFAKVSPSDEQCTAVIAEAEAIVQKTVPAAMPVPMAVSAERPSGAQDGSV